MTLVIVSPTLSHAGQQRTENREGFPVVPASCTTCRHLQVFPYFQPERGGGVVRMQTGEYIYFARACILAIYADQPAARKCSLTGSACPVCVTPAKHMTQAEQEPRHALRRTEKNMRNRKRILTLMCTSGEAKANEKAQKRAKSMGINLDVENAWIEGERPAIEKVWGTCPKRDNIWQCLPQPNLHGMDEGLNAKTNSGVLEALIKEAKTETGANATQVHSVTTSLFYTAPVYKH